jgi:hypothetical protein
VRNVPGSGWLRSVCLSFGEDEPSLNSRFDDLDQQRARVVKRRVKCGSSCIRTWKLSLSSAAK